MGIGSLNTPGDSAVQPGLKTTVHCDSQMNGIRGRAVGYAIYLFLISSRVH